MSTLVMTVFCAFHRDSVDLPGTATSLPRILTKERSTCLSEFPAAACADFLAHPHSLCTCVQTERDRARTPDCKLVQGRDDLWVPSRIRPDSQAGCLWLIIRGAKLPASEVVATSPTAGAGSV